MLAGECSDNNSYLVQISVNLVSIQTETCFSKQTPRWYFQTIPAYLCLRHFLTWCSI